MPRLVAPLTDVQVKDAKPKDKAYELADGGGLYLEVSPASPSTTTSILSAPERPQDCAWSVGRAYELACRAD